jgi:hypothetical protein
MTIGWRYGAWPERTNGAVHLGICRHRGEQKLFVWRARYISQTCPPRKPGRNPKANPLATVSTVAYGTEMLVGINRCEDVAQTSVCLAGSLQTEGCAWSFNISWFIFCPLLVQDAWYIAPEAAEDL